MPYSASGVFSPAITFIDGTDATAADQNTQDVDIAAGLTQALTRGGLAPATANISFGGFKATNLGNAFSPGDAVSLNFLSNYTFAALQITTALGYTPANKAGDTFTGGVTISAGGLSVTGGASFASGGVVSAGGWNVSGGTLQAGGGTFSVAVGGNIASTTGSLTLTSGGLTVGGATSLAAATATTATSTDNSTKIATTAFVNGATPLIVAGIAFGAVGSHAGAGGPAGLAPGDTSAGSGLAIFYSNTNTSVAGSGTWRYMGTATFSANGAIWLRIA